MENEKDEVASRSQTEEIEVNDDQIKLLLTTGQYNEDYDEDNAEYIEAGWSIWIWYLDNPIFIKVNYPAGYSFVGVDTKYPNGNIDIVDYDTVHFYFKTDPANPPAGYILYCLDSQDMDNCKVVIFDVTNNYGLPAPAPTNNRKKGTHVIQNGSYGTY